jgi:hypothetical protein
VQEHIRLLLFFKKGEKNHTKFIACLWHGVLDFSIQTSSLKLRQDRLEKQDMEIRIPEFRNNHCINI